MYSYSHDADTGGLLLRPEPLAFSLEPRPVYHRELTLLGFDKICQYPRSDEAPIMWAEANNYFYRGRKVARATGGSLYGAPRLEVLDEGLRGSELVSVDVAAMVERNRGLVDSLAEEAMGFVYNKRRRYARQVDLFYVAYSGGKDSQVVLDLVRRALPADAFKVLFGDTLMEFPDTYSAVEQTSAECRASGIDFVRARSHLEPAQSWRLFGPPATVQRWCCSVHKTAPQVLALRRLTGKADCRGFAFIGIRGAESERRSEYQRVAVGKKHTGQWNAYPILDWNSAELFAYMLQRRLLVNEAYKRGSHRVGCLMCPMSPSGSSYIRRQLYTAEVDKMVSIINDLNTVNVTEQSQRAYVEGRGWRARSSGRDLKNASREYSERTGGGQLRITLRDQTNAWRQWMTAIGECVETSPSNYSVTFGNQTFAFTVMTDGDGLLSVTIEDTSRTNARFFKLFRRVFRKAHYCVSCGVCSANCRNGNIGLDEAGKITVSNDCTHCGTCLDEGTGGCLAYDSLKLNDSYMGNSAKHSWSINSYNNHPPTLDWVSLWLRLGDKFNAEIGNHLGANKTQSLRRFLREADLSDGSRDLPIGTMMRRNGLNDEAVWGLIFAQSAYSPLIGWAVQTFDFNVAYPRQSISEILDSLENLGARARQYLPTDLRHLTELPIGPLGLGTCEASKDGFTLTRHPWPHPSPLAVLYSLYLYAERCGGLHHFTLPRLYDPSVQADGISPARIYGLDADTLRALLQGLAIAHPDFIGVSFTHGLDAVDLNETRQHGDVIALFNTDKP